MTTYCWKCHKLVSEQAKVGFRAECPFCGVDLHTCVNCKNYAPGKPNDCLIPGTEWVKDRETMNFCEEFVPMSPSSQANEARKKGKDLFNSLFKTDE